jgi:hypothetical protein
MKHLALAFLTAISISACGGGGSSGEVLTLPPEQAPQSPPIVQVQPAPAIQESKPTPEIKPAPDVEQPVFTSIPPAIGMLNKIPPPLTIGAPLILAPVPVPVPSPVVETKPVYTCEYSSVEIKQ